MLEVIQFLRLMSKPHFSLARTLGLPHAMFTRKTQAQTTTTTTTITIFIFLSKIIHEYSSNLLLPKKKACWFKFFKELTFSHVSFYCCFFNCICLQIYRVQLGIMSVIKKHLFVVNSLYDCYTKLIKYL